MLAMIIHEGHERKEFLFHGSLQHPIMFSFLVMYSIEVHIFYPDDNFKSSIV